MTEQERLRALEAGHILESAVFRAVFETLDGKYVRQWRAAKDTADREEAWRRQSVLRDVQSDLYSLLDKAMLAAKGKDEQVNTCWKRVRSMLHE